MLGPLALELAPVRINCVAAGLTRTNFWNRLGMSAEAQAAMFLDGERSIPLRHVAAPEEIAHALLFAATNPVIPRGPFLTRMAGYTSGESTCNPNNLPSEVSQGLTDSRCQRRAKG